MEGSPFYPKNSLFHSTPGNVKQPVAGLAQNRAAAHSKDGVHFVCKQLVARLINKNEKAQIAWLKLSAGWGRFVHLWRQPSRALRSISRSFSVRSSTDLLNSTRNAASS